MLARLCAIAVVLVVALPARAADKRAAAQHFQKGRALFEAGSYGAALDEFSAGYDAYPLPGFLVNIGQCQRKLDRLDDAAASFQKFLDSSSGDARLRGEVQDALDEIATERARRQQAQADAEAAARRQRDAAEARQPLEEPVARPDLTVHASSPALIGASEPVATVQKQPTKSRRWVWAVVGVLAAGVTAAAVSVAVIETTSSPSAQPGSLGLLDGRR